MPKNGEALDKAIIKHGAKQTESNRQSNSSINKQENKETSKPITLPEFIDSDLWNDFMEIRKKKKAINSDRAIKSLIKKLEEAESRGEGQANIEIERSVENSWKSIFPNNDSITKLTGSFYAGHSIAGLNAIVEKMRSHQATTQEIDIFTAASKEGFKPSE